MKKCKLCKQLNVRERNGIAVSKYCVACRKVKAEEKKAKRKLTKTYQQSQFKKLHRQAWALISQYVRQSAADSFGMVHCYTCGERKHFKELHCGHFHHNKLDFDLRNLRPQCAHCNTYNHGNLSVYGTKLAQEYGAEGMDKLLLDSNTVIYTNEDLENIIEEYKLKLKQFD